MKAGNSKPPSPEISFWELEEWLRPPDLLIVGGGITGASAALFYKQQFPDHDVVITDKGLMPEGASTRNAGFACIGSISEHLADMKSAGEETVMKRVERRWRGLRLLRETLGEESIGYEHTGGHEIFTDPRLLETCREEMGRINDILFERLGEKEIYSLKTYEGYPAIFNRVEGAVHSGRLMRTLHKKIARLGVRTWWNSPVESIGENGVRFGNGLEICPKKTLLAVNGFASRLTNLPVQPARGVVLVTKPLPGLPWKGTFHHNEGYIYFRNAGDRLLLGGARNLAKDEETTDHFGINPEIRSHLVRFADEVLHLPEGWSVEMVWSGIMGMTADKEPVIRQVEKNVWAAAGLSGMGIAIGMEVARGVVRRLVET